MFPKGIIYQSGVSKRRGVIILKASLKVRLMYGTLRGLSSGIIGFAVMALVFTFGPILKEEIDFQLHSSQYQQQYLDRVKADQESQVRQEATELGIDPGFSVYIPKIEAKSKIIANVDVNSVKEYQESLTEGVAHAKGTYFPGQNKLIYLFAHSTDSPLNFARYNAVFYMVRKLEKGDQIIIYFADHKYEYKVTEKVIVPGTDVSWLTKKYDSETLVLQTCDPPGTTWNRLIVVATPI